MKSHILLPAITLALLCSTMCSPAETLLGTLQSPPEHADRMKQAGLQLATVELGWGRFEPRQGEVDRAYADEVAARAAAFRAAGLKVVLDLGVQYPPDWLLALPHARYVNQHGDTFVETSPGKNIANSVFNAAVREAQAAYMARVFQHLGAEFHAVRLGGGWYGELNYPPHQFSGQANCYWAFDALAQGREPGLPAGIEASPVPGWIPGTESQDHADAAKFLDWYLEALRNYQDWQVATARRHFAGTLLMLYPSWGIRPGQIEAAVSADLAGTTPPEKNGEIQRGFDFARLIDAIKDPDVVVQCTWLDANPEFGDENGTDPAGWSPIKFLASLAKAHQPPLSVSGENTGGGGGKALTLSLERAHQYGLSMFFWAFGPDLVDGSAPELEDLGKHAVSAGTQP